MDGKNPHVYIPLEFCLVIKQNCNRKLNQDQMAIMARNTALSADDRERKISEKVREAKFDKDEYLRDFGIKVNTSMKELTGRVLDPPRLEYKGHQFAWPDRGEWKARKKHFYNGTKIGDSWGIIYIQQIAPDQIDIRKFIQSLVRAGRDNGMDIGYNPCVYEMSYEENVKQVIESFKGIKLIIVILDKKGTIKYSA
jgi:eukaryotic translation initiation factor 2C